MTDEDDMLDRLVRVTCALGEPFAMTGASDGSVTIVRKGVDRLDEVPLDGPTFAALERLVDLLEEAEDEMKVQGCLSDP